MGGLFGRGQAVRQWSVDPGSQLFLYIPFTSMGPVATN